MSTSYTAKGDEQGNPKQIYSTDEVLTGGYGLMVVRFIGRFTLEQRMLQEQLK